MRQTHDQSWYYWKGGLLVVGRRPEANVLALHAHPVIEIIALVEGEMLIAQDGETWVGYDVAVLRESVPHAVIVHTAHGAVLMVDPFSRIGRLLSRQYPAPITRLSDPPRAIREIVRDMLLHRYELARISKDAELLLQQFSRNIVAPTPIDARVARSLELIKSGDPRQTTLKALSNQFSLSPSRFAHLFSENVGMSFGRYMLWYRLTNAWGDVTKGATMSMAAHAAGFTDAAHFTRTFQQKFGVAPSIRLRDGDWFQIEDPTLMQKRAANEPTLH